MTGRSSTDGPHQGDCHSSGQDACFTDTPTSADNRIFLSNKVNHLSNFFQAINIFLNQATTVAVCGTHIGINAGDYENDPDTCLQEDKAIGLGTGIGLTFLVAVIWYARQEISGHADATKIRQQLNPWYRRFKTANSFGNSIGQSLGELIVLLPFIPLGFHKPIKIALSSIFGFAIGFFAATFLPSNPICHDDNAIFYLGRDGWSKYTKAGLPLGSAIGAAIGAVIGFLLPIPGGMAAGIAIGGALGAVIGFVGFTAIVPLINKIKLWWQPKTETSNHCEKESITFRTNYIRVGTTFGTYLGLIIGFIVGIFVPIPGAALFCSTLGAGIGAAIGAITVGILGPIISAKVRDKSSSSWDYGARTGALLGSQMGVGSVFTGAFTLFGVGSEIKIIKDLIYALTGLIAGVIGGIYDAYCSYKNWGKSDEEIQKELPLLPWSQRVATFAVIGSFLGSILGLVIGTAIAGPVGGAIGLAIGTGLGCMIMASIGAKWGDTIILKYADFAARFATKSEEENKNPEKNDYQLLNTSTTKITTSMLTPSKEEVSSSNEVISVPTTDLDPSMKPSFFSSTPPENPSSVSPTSIPPKPSKTD